MPKPVSSNAKPISLTVPADPVISLPYSSTKNAPKKKGKGKSVEVSRASAPKVLPQSTSVQNSPFRPRRKFEREEGEVALYHTKGTVPLDQYAGLTKKEFALMKKFCIDQGLCTADDADGFVKEIFSDKTKLHELKFKYESLFQLAVYDRSLEVLKLLVEQGGVPSCPSIQYDLLHELLLGKTNDGVCKAPDFKLADFLIKNCGFDVGSPFDGADCHNWNCLSAAIDEGSPFCLEVVKFLIKNGADVRQSMKNKRVSFASSSIFDLESVVTRF
jgi:hypothetical protein